MKERLWAGRMDGNTSELADELNSSISVDCRMYRQDIKGSIAHAKMLAKQNIISNDDASLIVSGLEAILCDIESGRLKIDKQAEDIHMFVESELTKRTGDAGKKLHTARSRNDQVTLDLRLWLKDRITEIISALQRLEEILCVISEKNFSVIMPGYTHLQRAQPVLFSHYMMAYAMMFDRDADRLRDCFDRMNVSPIGSCALAGTSYNTDRDYEAGLLGFESVSLNSVDGVSDRDYAIEFTGCLSILQMHLSRFSEELVLWSGLEFGFIEFSDGYTTGSSIMPQKKNPDMAELVRGKTGRVYGDLMTLLTVFKGLPLAYNKDMQEDKEAVFDAADTVLLSLNVFAGMLCEMKINAENMENAAKRGFINATDMADYLVGKGMPFRDAYKISGEIVRECIKKGCVLDEYPLDDYKKHSDFFDEGVYDAIKLKRCVEARCSKGGTSPSSVREQIAYIRGKNSENAG